jgi:ribonucleoside-diphosphate reductase alpha chain
MTLTLNAIRVLEKRYLAEAETPEGMFRRVARAIAAVDAGHGASDGDVQKTEQLFYDRMSRLEFLPNSPTLMNGGRPSGQLAACFVLPVEDSTEGIFDAVKWTALIQKTGGGTGFSFSRLRPAGDHVESSGGEAGGPVSFMQAFNAATEAIKQGGRRRGANMAVLRVDHPDILNFITIKLDPSRMTNFNLSVGVTDAFMKAVERDEEFDLINPRTGEVDRRIPARRVMDLIVNVAWRIGDPGLLFLDRINEANPTPHLGLIEATNPCGEQPLLPFESCVLGSINLAKFVEAEGADVDWDSLRGVVRDGVHFLDNVIDASVYPVPQIEQITRTNRKVGLGVMGFADLLIELGIPYDSKAALDLAARLAGFIETESLQKSAELAEARAPFGGWEKSKWADGPPLRNATTTTVAPTGTISIIAGCSSGIEPLFAIGYQRHVMDGDVLREFHDGFRERADRDGFWSDELAARIAESGVVRGLDEVPAEVQALYPTAHDLTPADHVRMQAAFQRHSHAAVSKTVNLSHEAAPAAIEEVYNLAFQLGCKGVTVYRDRSRSEQVLAFGSAAETPGASPDESCPDCGSRLRAQSGCLACPTCGWSVCEL